MSPAWFWCKQQTKTIQKRKLQTNIFDDYRCKNPQKNIQLKHKNKIKTVNTQTSKLLNMLVASYNKQQIKK